MLDWYSARGLSRACQGRSEGLSYGTEVGVAAEEVSRRVAEAQRHAKSIDGRAIAYGPWRCEDIRLGPLSSLRLSGLS
jgi:hypothetical protein